MLSGLVGQTCHMSNTPISFLSSLVSHSSNVTLIDVRPQLCTGTLLNDLIPFQSNFQSGRDLTVQWEQKYECAFSGFGLNGRIEGSVTKSYVTLH